MTLLFLINAIASLTARWIAVTQTFSVISITRSWISLIFRELVRSWFG